MFFTSLSPLTLPLPKERFVRLAAWIELALWRGLPGLRRIEVFGFQLL
jgi:hypothetical protein